MTNPDDLVLIDGRRIRTPRLLLRPWAADDAAAALAVFGDEHVARWLAPAVGRVPDVETMRALLPLSEADDERHRRMMLGEIKKLLLGYTERALADGD